MEVQIDLEAIRGEVAEISDEAVREQLVALRTRQRVAQKKYHDPAKQKLYQAKNRERQRLMVERAKGLGIYEEILVEAGQRADEQLTAAGVA